MTKRTRLFMLSSVAVLGGGLCIGLVAYLGGFPAVRVGAAAANDDLHYVPSDASVVAYANVREVMLSDIRQRLRQVDPDGRGQREFQERTGINLETDVDHIVACMLPSDDEGGGFVLARGRFDEVRLEALGREHGATIESYQDQRIVQSEHGALVMLEPGLVLVGESDAVRRAIDTLGSGQDVTSNSEMMRLVSEVDASSNTWAVGRFDALTRRGRLPEHLSDQMPAVQWFAASGRINGGVTGTLRAETRDAEAADQLRDVVRGFLALAKMQSGSTPNLQTFLDSLQLGGTGSTVALSFMIPTALMDALASRPHAEPQ